MRALTLFVLAFTIPGVTIAQSASDLAYKRCDEAKGSVDQVVAICTESLKEKSLTVRTRARLHAIRGNAYSRDGDLQKAMTEYNESLRVDPQ